MSLTRFFGPLFLAGLLFGCESQNATISNQPASHPFPSKDEVMLVDGRPVNISEFTAIRNRLNGENLESVFWMTSAALALVNESKIRGVPISMDAALTITRFGKGQIEEKEVEEALRTYWKNQGKVPSSKEISAHIENLLARSVVQRNARVLAEFR